MTSEKTSGNIYVAWGKQRVVEKGAGGYRGNIGSALRYRQRGEQTVIVCVPINYVQPNMSEGFQEVIIIFVPEGMRYNRVWHWAENKSWIERDKRRKDESECLKLRETEASQIQSTEPALCRPLNNYKLCRVIFHCQQLWITESCCEAGGWQHILKMATPRLGLVIVFLPTVALCLTFCDWVTEQQGMKLPVSLFSYSLITAAG